MIKGSSDTKNLGGSPENKMIKFGVQGVKETKPQEKQVDLVIKADTKKEEVKPKA